MVAAGEGVDIMKATFLSRFTPSLMELKVLEAIFVQRERLAQRILELIRDSALTLSKYHTLLIGPRGIGKTHLIALVYHRVQAMDDLRDHLLIAWLREEEWGVVSFLDLLLRIFRALLAEYDDAALAERVESLYDLPPDAAERAGAMLLKEFVGNRTLLILVENLDDLFDGLGDEGQKRFRAYLQENPFCTILATAQSLFNGVSLRTSPFYGFFRIHHLEELDFDEAASLLTKIADFEGDGELVSFIQTPDGRARIRAVHHLAGGNHRVYVIFSQFLTRKSLDELVEPLMRAMDDLTPYYQARMAYLSPQQRKIAEFLCDRRNAIPVKEIARRCFMTHQTASSQLKILREMGYIRYESIGRESYYELREPLMRLCVEVKKHRGEPIRLFVDFLRLWYSQAELQQRLELLQSDETLEREYILRALRAIEEENEGPSVAARLKNYNAYVEAGDFTRALEVAKELIAIRGNAQDWFRQGYCLADRGYYNPTLGCYEEALKFYNKAIELNPNEVLAWCYRGVALGHLGHLDEALASCDKAIELNPKEALVWRGRGWVLSKLRRWNEALASYEKAIELDPNETRAWSRRVVALVMLGRLDEALASSDKAIELDPNEAAAWRHRSFALVRLKRWNEALAACEKAIKLGEQSPYVFFQRAEALLALNRWDEGISALDDALDRFAHADEPNAGDTEAILHNLFTGTHEVAIWRERIMRLINIYDKHQVPAALGQGLVQNIPALNSPMVSNAAAQMWRDVWQELVDDRNEFQIPLRLLDVAVRYRETQDQRVLLELPIEERTLLEQLLEIERPSNLKKQ
jgi:tetratricopeptide (TPR) repeat protein